MKKIYDNAPLLEKLEEGFFYAFCAFLIGIVLTGLAGIVCFILQPWCDCFKFREFAITIVGLVVFFGVSYRSNRIFRSRRGDLEAIEKALNKKKEKKLKEAAAQSAKPHEDTSAT